MSMGDDIKEARLEIYDAVVIQLEYLGHTASVHEDYSGRGMFGETTPGIVSNAPAVLVGHLLAHAIMTHAPKTRPMELLPLRWDNMGMDIIYY